jgi:GDSL-like Lipase/Acylhydrolase family
MRRDSSTWLFSVWLLVAGPCSAATPRPVCLPPLFEGGARLHPLTDVRLMWLEPLLRQHEVCWRDQPDEQRVMLFGNSAVFGFPLPVEQSFGALLNAHFAAAHVPAHLFNLAWVYTYQVRDALIMHEALRYDPDVIVYPITLGDMVHVAPMLWLAGFFESNVEPLTDMAEAPPPGLGEPFARYQSFERGQGIVRRLFNRLRDVGLSLRLMIHRHAVVLTQRIATLPPEAAPPAETGGAYDCARTLSLAADRFRDWRDWSMPAYLASLRAHSGAAMLLINWPIAHEPNGECYNVRYSNALVAQFNEWLAAEAQRYGLAYLDLHDLLPPSDFIDSLHITPAGQQRIAARVAAELDPIVLQRLHAQQQ